MNVQEQTTQYETVSENQRITVTLNQGESEYERIRWVLQSICKDKTRQNLCFVNASSDKVTCTNGMTLFQVDNNECLLPGMYTVLSNTAKLIVLQRVHNQDSLTFPNYEMVIPKNNLIESDIYTGKEGGNIDDKMINLQRVINHISLAYGKPWCCNAKFIEWAILGGKLDKCYIKQSQVCEVDGDDDVYTPDPLSALLLRGNDRLCVIMPVIRA